MSTEKPTYHELQARLAQAEALLIALRDGEVDAVISHSDVLFLTVKEADEALREGEARYRTLFTYSLEAILLTATDGRIVMANPAACRLFGWTADELGHLRAAALVDHTDPPTRAAWAERARAGQFQGELSYRRKDGSIFTGETSAATFGEPEGEQKTTVLIRDVTVRKEAEAERQRLYEEVEQRVVERTRTLRVTNAELRWEIAERKRTEAVLYAERRFVSAVLETTDALIVVTDPRGRIVRFNRACERLTGYAFDEVRSTYLWELALLPEEIKPVLKAFWEQPFTEQFTHSLDNEWVAKDGSRRLISWSNTAMRDEHGHPEYFIHIGVDITERQRAEELLQKERIFVSAVLDTADALIMVCDTRGCIVRFNRACERLTGYAFADVRGHCVWELRLLPAEIKPVAKALWEQLHMEEFPLQRENEWVTKDGSRRLITWSNTVLRDDRGHIEYIVATGIDITERRLAEEAHRAITEQLRALSARLSAAREEEGTRIARQLHDELGSALTSLKWDVESIEKLCDEAQTDSAILRDKIAGMLEMIDTTISSVKSIASELRPGILDDLGLVAALEWQAQQFAACTGIRCHFEAVGETQEVSREQATVLFRICQEALTNILRHTQATTVSIVFEEEEDGVVLVITDNGKGITEEESVGQRSLGLIGMRERAQLIGGSMTITGVTGKGTVLTVRLPLASSAAD